jgi:DNA-directed RNA polymerase specialized sigma24 family protein
MSKRKEYPYNPLQPDGFNRAKSLGAHRPLDELEMLMQESPGSSNHHPVPLTRTAALKDVLGETIDALPPEDRYIVEQLFIAGLSLRKTGAILGIPKTTLARRRDRIRRHLIAELVDKPSVRKWLTD